MFKNMKLATKLIFGFSMVVLGLAAVAIWSSFGIGQLIGQAERMTEGNALRDEVVQKEVDHLNWAQKVSKLFTDENVTELNAQVDHTKCAF
ncbi:MAG: hypothetical protein ABIH04_05265, partial [Planctomycetota bacterium]